MTARQQNQIAAAGPACRRADRTRRFIARIDAHLPRRADDRARRAFLARQLEGWECRYARFIATQGASASTRDPPHAADFLRSEERRVGKECRSRWSAYDSNKHDI